MGYITGKAIHREHAAKTQFFGAARRIVPVMCKGKQI
jgi:hypothetical protein